MCVRAYMRVCVRVKKDTVVTFMYACDTYVFLPLPFVPPSLPTFLFVPAAGVLRGAG